MFYGLSEWYENIYFVFLLAWYVDWDLEISLQKYMFSRAPNMPNNCQLYILFTYHGPNFICFKPVQFVHMMINIIVNFILLITAIIYFYPVTSTEQFVSSTYHKLEFQV